MLCGFWWTDSISYFIWTFQSLLHTGALYFTVPSLSNPWPGVLIIPVNSSNSDKKSTEEPKLSNYTFTDLRDFKTSKILIAFYDMFI